MEEKLKVFEFELSQIKSPDIRKFTEECIKILPDYFFKVAASSTGKYHPQYALGDGGLVRHTRAAVRFAIEMFNFHSMQNYNEEMQSIIIASLILHDGCKHGLKGSKYTITEHPLVVADYIRQHKEICNLINEEVLKKILEGIETHMTEWNKDFKTQEEVLPLPKHGYQKYIGLCDYLASRKCIEINFEA